MPATATAWRHGCGWSGEWDSWKWKLRLCEIRHLSLYSSVDVSILNMDMGQVCYDHPYSRDFRGSKQVWNHGTCNMWKGKAILLFLPRGSRGWIFFYMSSFGQRKRFRALLILGWYLLLSESAVEHRVSSKPATPGIFDLQRMTVTFPKTVVWWCWILVNWECVVAGEDVITTYYRNLPYYPSLTPNRTPIFWGVDKFPLEWVSAHQGRFFSDLRVS